MIKNGNTVSVHYTGKLTTGEEFDSSIGKDPITFSIGAGHVIEGFEKAVIGKNVGDKVTTHIPFMEAYGPIREELIIKVQNSQLPGKVEVGQILQAQGQDNSNTNVLVKEVHTDHAVIDANHPFAGKDLIFDIEVVKIED